MSRKYQDYRVKFNFFDDYILWLWEVRAKKNDNKYYMLLEEDMMEYSNMQTGSPREMKTDEKNDIDEEELFWEDEEETFL